jgi:hypothetical protein
LIHPKLRCDAKGLLRRACSTIGILSEAHHFNHVRTADEFFFQNDEVVSILRWSCSLLPLEVGRGPRDVDGGCAPRGRSISGAPRDVAIGPPRDNTHCPCSQCCRYWTSSQCCRCPCTQYCRFWTRSHLTEIPIVTKTPAGGRRVCLFLKKNHIGVIISLPPHIASALKMICNIDASYSERLSADGASKRILPTIR